MRSKSPRYRWCGAASAAALASAASGQSLRYDLGILTELGDAAVQGLNVSEPVEGFELVLLKDGQTVYRRAFGVWTPGRVANADSATKTLSGALVMSLVDHSPSAFSLDTRLSEYIPAFSGLRAGITIRQCFAHTSGLRDSDAVGDRRLTLQEAALAIADEPVRFVPGAVFSYGGTSMHAAGAAAELAGAASWNDLFALRIAGPLGMVSTRYTLTTPENPRIAGGCESTATDFAAFMEMLRRGGVHQGTRILSEQSVATMLTRQTPLDIPIANSPLEGSADYGIGIWLDRRHPDGSLEGALAAGARGFSAWIDLDDGMSGAFATDLTRSPNIQPLLTLIRDAAQAAVRRGPLCPADFNADGAANTQDFFDFLADFFAGDADYNFDGNINSQDFFNFLEAFFGGC